MVSSRDPLKGLSRDLPTFGDEKVAFGCISWLIRASDPHHQDDIIMFFFGNSELNLKKCHYYWEGGQQKLCLVCLGYYQRSMVC